MRAPEIRIENLQGGYDGRIILDDVSVTLPAGRISVILGGSGGGKSTLLKHILGLEKPMAGDIVIGGRSLYGMTPEQLYRHKRDMGVLFQDGALLGSLSLGENVALPLREHTTLDEVTMETVVAMKLGLVGLAPFASYFPSQLSGGMRKRAGLARAMVLDPKILLCDEPSSGLDPITAAELDDLIIRLNHTFGMTIVVVTHDLDSLMAIAEYVVVLKGGKVLYKGDLDGLKNSEDVYIRQFLARQPQRSFQGI